MKMCLKLLSLFKKSTYFLLKVLLITFKVMKKYSCQQLIFSSSCTVYGNPKFLPITEDHPVGEITNVYGKTKHFIEQMLKDISAAEEVTRHSTSTGILRVLL